MSGLKFSPRAPTARCRLCSAEQRRRSDKIKDCTDSARFWEKCRNRWVYISRRLANRAVDTAKFGNIDKKISPKAGGSRRCVLTFFPNSAPAATLWAHLAPKPHCRDLHHPKASRVQEWAISSIFARRAGKPCGRRLNGMRRPIDYCMGAVKPNANWNLYVTPKPAMNSTATAS